MTIIFETHSISTDNELGIASGWNDVGLLAKGKMKAMELFERRKSDNLSAVYCSDLKRALQSAKAFKGVGIPVFKDARLRECNYGDMNGMETERVKLEKPNRINTPFPNGERYIDCAKRIEDFLKDIAKKYNNNDKIMIIGHKATQYGLEHHLLGYPLTNCIKNYWEWQPGWGYEFNNDLR